MADSVEHQILQLAKECGASVAGLVGVRDVGEAPSAEELPPVRWPEGARTVLVLGLIHAPDEPELDWWGGPGGTPGNRVLQRVSQELKHRLAARVQATSWILPYHVERGGIFLKDAAVLAGLGAMGLNNLVITPQWGPRVRWRAMLLDVAPPEDGEEAGRFDPCDGCARPCIEVCPQQALAGGRYNLHRCAQQMHLDDVASDLEAGTEGEAAVQVVKYCRACELACPVGQ